MRHLFIDRDGFTVWREVDDPTPRAVVIPRVPRLPVLPLGTIDEHPGPYPYERRQFEAVLYESDAKTHSVVFIEDGDTSGIINGLVLAELQLVDALHWCLSAARAQFRRDYVLVNCLSDQLRSRGRNV